MYDLRELYQEIILDHNRRPRNRGVLDDASSVAEGYNPLCGDNVKVFVKLDDGRISDVRFEGSGCAISTASASIMTEQIRGKTIEEARDLFRRLHDVVAGRGSAAAEDALGPLAVFSGVRAFPARVKCATLAWHALKAALEEPGARVTTEEGS